MFPDQLSSSVVVTMMTSVRVTLLTGTHYVSLVLLQVFHLEIGENNYLILNEDIVPEILAVFCWSQSLTCVSWEAW